MQKIFVRVFEGVSITHFIDWIKRVLRYEETNATQIKYKLTYRRKKSNYEITIFFISDEEKKNKYKTSWTWLCYPNKA